MSKLSVMIDTLLSAMPAFHSLELVVDVYVSEVLETNVHCACSKHNTYAQTTVHWQRSFDSFRQLNQWFPNKEKKNGQNVVVDN